MGYYIEVPHDTGKAQLIADGKALILVDDKWRQAPEYKAEIIERPASFADVPENKALICVISNPFFEAAGCCFDEREFEAFTQPDDHRARTWLLMDKNTAEQCSRYRNKS